MNIPRMIEELDKFLELSKLRPVDMGPGYAYLGSQMWNAGSDEAIQESAHVVEKILDRILPRWRTTVPDDENESVNRWCQHREAATRAKVELLRREELADMLGDNAPTMSAGQIHPWIWDSARALWQNGHYRQAIHTAAVVLNDETQKKIGRKDVSEKDLFRQAFTTKAPEPGKARLRIMADDGSPTYTSLQEGAAAFGEGCYRAIRNPSSHTVQHELPEQEALEQLAAFSVLARWVDNATVEKAP